MALDIDHLKQWIGRTESRDDIAAATPVQALSATLDRDDPVPQPGDPVPPCWHWLYFLPLHRQSEIGADGHPKRGGFLPPVLLPRRMWAGSRMAFHRPLCIGSPITRVSRIADVSGKQGRSGSLIFVRVRHEVSDDGGLVLTDEHDIVYRDNPKPGDPLPPAQAAPAEHEWIRTIQPDDVLLFRYSALTFNGHRIHYDRRYVTEVEGYPGLVVHGPLLATLLLDLLRRNLPEATVARFAFRALKPTFDTQAFDVCGRRADDGKTIHLWARHEDGALAMDATAHLA
ncbi:MaoC family dehydratase N-terminal domain-containing protein [Aquincola sp. S2]|uniref:MaoC family dehydratase N-terminal domain-containing protein n=1 Tax=Pseudaquabacterium terrae TaxID=2732868 RepID=A0ABX2EGQ6_9BURK|nr:MaoC family dehydratase N-terminal domain-containing protein [Aquabacterium terrae]NRF67779.1 MaoC family dehydratase N-terminal domain-containing protein [Aquabacterium terrae]